MKRLWIIVLAVAILTGCSSHSTSSGSGSGSGAASFVKKESQDAGAAAQDATALIAEAAVADPLDDSGMTQLAADAQTLHGHLDDFRQSLLLDADAGSGDDIDLVTAENDLKSAVGAVNTWTGNPNASTSASWQRQMGTAIGEWNTIVAKLWSKAGVTPVPTITIPK